MQSLQQTVRVGLFFLLGVALVWVTFETLSDGKFFKEQGYTLIAGFDSLKDLKVGDEVRMAGVRIGSVQETRLAGRRAEAVLRIQPKVAVANDAVATIAMSGLIGTNQIAIDLGSSTAPILTDGMEIRTKVTPDLNTIMTQLGALGDKLNGALSSFGGAMNGDGKNGPGLFQKLDKLVTDNSEKIDKTMANLQDITTKINTGQGTLGKLVNDPALHDQLLAAVDELKSTAITAKGFMNDAQGIVDQVKSGKGTLGQLLYNDEIANNIKTTVRNIKDVSDKMARGEGTLGKLINDDSLYISAQSTLKKADRALDGLNDSGPITAVGVVANSLF